MQTRPTNKATVWKKHHVMWVFNLYFQRSGVILRKFTIQTGLGCSLCLWQLSRLYDSREAQHCSSALTISATQSTANSLHSIWQPCQPVPSILCNNTKKFCYSQACCCPLRISEIQSFLGNLTGNSPEALGFSSLWSSKMESDKGNCVLFLPCPKQNTEATFMSRRHP